jgi:hypothetical protein
MPNKTYLENIRSTKDALNLIQCAKASLEDLEIQMPEVKIYHPFKKARMQLVDAETDLKRVLKV